MNTDRYSVVFSEGHSFDSKRFTEPTLAAARALADELVKGGRKGEGWCSVNDLSIADGPNDVYTVRA